MDEELKGEIQVGLGRHLIGREVGGLDQIVRQHGTPEIEIGEPRRPGDKQRPVRLTWVVDGERMSSVIPATTPSENPHNLVRDHQERLGRERGGTLVTETQRIGLNGRRTIERRVDHFPPPKSAHVADRALRPKPRARGAGRPKAQATR